MRIYKSIPEQIKYKYNIKKYKYKISTKKQRKPLKIEQKFTKFFR